MSRFIKTIKQQRANGKGFTLIELLIVVAIIAILAAIAVPNFLEAQTRAKIARVQSDMKVVVTGVEMMFADKGVLLVDFWDDDTNDGRMRMAAVFDMPWKRQNYQGGTTGLFTPLTTPVAYIQTVPVDAFCEFLPDWSGLVGDDQLPPWSFMYVDHGTDPADRGDAGLRIMNGDYLIFSVGPDTKSNWTEGINLTYYDSSNGTKSSGDIIYSRLTNFETRRIRR